MADLDPRERGRDSDDLLALLAAAGAEQGSVVLIAGAYDTGRATRLLRTSREGRLHVEPESRASQESQRFELITIQTAFTAIPASLWRGSILGSVSAFALFTIDSATTLGVAFINQIAITSNDDEIPLRQFGPFSAASDYVLPLVNTPYETALTGLSITDFVAGLYSLRILRAFE